MAAYISSKETLLVLQVGVSQILQLQKSTTIILIVP